jgi:hypothetical protein
VAAGPGWLWAIPLGGALALFYARTFAAAFVGAPISAGALISGLAGLLGGWLLRAWLLQQFSAGLGGRTDFAALYRVAAWASFPLILRDAVQAGYMLSAGRPIADPGLAFLVTDAVAGLGGKPSPAGAAIGALWREILGRADLYTAWHLALLVVAVALAARLSHGKAALAVAGYTLLSLAIGLAAALLRVIVG